MTNKELERELYRAGYRLERNGAKHGMWIKGDNRITVSHGKMSPWLIRRIIRQLGGIDKSKSN